MIQASTVLEGTKVGDSIAVNGICLTVTTLDSTSFSADVMPETISKTSLSSIQVGSKVNLERALQLTDRLGGHMVSGHIDGRGTIESILSDGNAIRYTIMAPKSILHYIIEKGSIAIDGISLTVVSVNDHSFEVSVIPHTLQETILPLKKQGDFVNLENDLIGKYVEKLIKKDSPTITRDFLLQHGF